MNSCLYVGQIRHRRLAPKPHFFFYRIFMAYLDLQELDTVFTGNPLWSTRRPALAWFRRADYLGDPSVPLDQAVRDLVEQKTGVRPIGPVRVLSHLRYFGYSFNPVSFYYCFDMRMMKRTRRMKRRLQRQNRINGNRKSKSRSSF